MDQNQFEELLNNIQQQQLQQQQSFDSDKKSLAFNNSQIYETYFHKPINKSSNNNSSNQTYNFINDQQPSPILDYPNSTNHDKFIYQTQQPNTSTTTHFIINQLQIPIQNINQQISNNIEITNNINTGGMMRSSSTFNEDQRQNSQPRSFSIVQKFKIQPLFNENNQPQFLDIKISNQQQKNNTYRKETTKNDSSDLLKISSARSHNVKKARNLLSAQGTFKSQVFESFKKGEDFAPLGYDELSDYDIDSDDYNKRKKSKKVPPSPINLNQLYINGTHRKSIQKRGSRKSSIHLQNLDQNQSRQSIRVENDTKRQSSLQLGVNDLDHKMSLKSSQISINGKPEHRSPMTKVINIDYLDTHQVIKNGLTPIEERNSPTISNHNQDEDHSNPTTTRQFLGATDDQLILPDLKNKEVNDQFLVQLQNEPEADFEAIREQDDNLTSQKNQDDGSEIKNDDKTDAVNDKAAESQVTSGNEKSASNMRSLRRNERFLDDICVDDAERLRKLKNYDYFIILPDDSFKQRWDLIITMIDIILNFFMAYYDESEDIVDIRKKIACRYIMNTDDYSSLARIARLPKLYRLIKVFRLVRLMKVVKERNTLIKQVNDLFKISAGFERLIFFIIMSIVVCHICGCFWIILAKLNDQSDDTWIFRYGYQDCTNFEVYIASMYFTLTTITTVGFGDITGFTPPERIMCIILMIIGVFSFSFSISSLSSMLSSIDSRNANLNEKLSTLNKIKKDYRIGFEFYRRLKMALKYDYQKNGAAQFSLVNELPQNLKIELSLIMHKEIVKKIFFFQNKPPHFIAFIGPLLKPLHVEEGNYIYKEKDPIEEIFFLTNGKAALVHKELKDSAYLIIDQGYYFGEIDFVFQNNDGKRRFTVKALDNCHLLTISKGDLGKVDVEYEEILQDLFNNAQKRLKRTLKIKDESESYFLKKQIQNQRLSVNQVDESAIRRMSTAFLTVKDKKKKTESDEKHLGAPSFDSSNVFGDGLSVNKEIKELNQIDEEDDEEDYEEGDEEEDPIKTDSTFLEQEKEMIQHQKEVEDQEHELFQLHRYQNDQRNISKSDDNIDDEEGQEEGREKQQKDDHEIRTPKGSIHQLEKEKQDDPGSKINSQSQLKKNQDPQDQEDHHHHKIDNLSDDSPFPQGSIDQLSFSSFDGNNDKNDDQKYNSNHAFLKDGNNSSKTLMQPLSKPKIDKKKTSEPMSNKERKFSIIQSLLTMPNQELIKNLQEGLKNKQKIPMRNMTQFDLNLLKKESVTEEKQSQKVIQEELETQYLHQKQQHLQLDPKKKKSKDKKKKLLIMRSRTNYNDDNPPIPIKKKTKTKNKDGDSSLQTPQIKKIESSMGDSQIQQSHDKDEKDQLSKHQPQLSEQPPIQENIEEDKQSQEEEEVIPKFDKSESNSSPIKDQTQITESINNTNSNLVSAKVSPVIPTLKFFQNNVQNIQVEAPTNSKPKNLLVSKNTQFEHLQKSQLVPPNFNAKQRKSVMLTPGQSGTLLDKLRQNSQRNLMNSLQRNVNSIIIENQFKRAILGDRSPSPLLSQKKPFGEISDVQSEAQHQNQNNLINQIEKNSKEMFDSMNQRINKIEEAIVGIEKSLQVLISIQANQGQNQEQQQLVSYIMGAINEINQENEINMQQRNSNNPQ